MLKIFMMAYLVNATMANELDASKKSKKRKFTFKVYDDCESNYDGNTTWKNDYWTTCRDTVSHKGQNCRVTYSLRSSVRSHNAD